MKSNVHVRKQMRESCGQRGKQVSVPIFSGHPNTDNARLNPLSLSRVHGSSYSLSLSDTTTRLDAGFVNLKISVDQGRIFLQVWLAIERLLCF